MIDLIVNSLKNTLRNQYPSIPRISEDLPQGFPEPCFYISVLNTNKKDLLKDRFLLNVPLDIHYFPSKSKNKKSEMNIKSMELLQVLKNITLVDYKLNEVGMLHGFNFHTEIVDNVLHFFVEYKPIMNTITSDDNLMGSLSRVVDVDG